MIRKRIAFIFPVITCFIFNLPSIYCQQEVLSRDVRISISTVYGNQQWIDVDYNYKSYMLKTSYLKEISSGRAISFLLLVQPIVGISDCLKNTSSTVWEKGYEIGLGLGGRIDVNLYQTRIAWFFALQSGPYYISIAPSRQLPGFLFSSEANTGFSFLLRGRTKMEVFLGFRHLSNAEVKLPNGGLNNLLMGIGMSFGI